MSPVSVFCSWYQNTSEIQHDPEPYLHQITEIRPFLQYKDCRFDCGVTGSARKSADSTSKHRERCFIGVFLLSTVGKTRDAEALFLGIIGAVICRLGFFAIVRPTYAPSLGKGF